MLNKKKEAFSKGKLHLFFFCIKKTWGNHMIQ
jgi:hypothetical protein